MRECELRYVDIHPRDPLTKALLATNNCTLRFNPMGAWTLWFRVQDARGGESVFAVAVDPYAEESVEGIGGTVHTIRNVENDEWLLWPPVEIGSSWEGVVVVTGMPQDLPWYPRRQLRDSAW
jgi:hypothetical protein